jgi:hypothetical protein
MTLFCVQYARRIPSKLLGLGSIVLSIWLLSSPAVAQVKESLPAFPEAPSASSMPAAAYVATPESTPHSFTFAERTHAYARSIFSVESIIGPAFGAGIGQWQDEPPGWGGGAEAYGKRFGSDIARRTISETVTFGFAAADGEDPRYFLSEDRGVWARTRHAVVSTVVSPTSRGTRIPAFSRFVGVYGAAFISNTWYPDNRATAGDAARRGSMALAGDVALHLFREFAPFHRPAHQ